MTNRWKRKRKTSWRKCFVGQLQHYFVHYTHTLAKRLNLKGAPCILKNTTFGQSEEVSEGVNTTCYKLSAWDTTGKRVEFEVVGVPFISRLGDEHQRKILENTFNETHEQQKQNTKSSKQDNIDILIGYDYAGFHPILEKCQDHKVLLKNRFGYIAAGSTRPITASGTPIFEAHTYLVSHSLDKFFEIESLGVQCTPKCGGCKCGKCHPGGSPMTLAEEKEWNLIDEKITFNEEKGCWVAELPWIRDPAELPYNESVACAVLLALEKKVEKKQSPGRAV